MFKVRVSTSVLRLAIALLAPLVAGCAGTTEDGQSCEEQGGVWCPEPTYVRVDTGVSAPELAENGVAETGLAGDASCWSLCEADALLQTGGDAEVSDRTSCTLTVSAADGDTGTELHGELRCALVLQGQCYCE